MLPTHDAPRAYSSIPASAAPYIARAPQQPPHLPPSTDPPSYAQFDRYAQPMDIPNNAPPSVGWDQHWRARPVTNTIFTAPHRVAESGLSYDTPRQPIRDRNASRNPRPINETMTLSDKMCMVLSLAYQCVIATGHGGPPTQALTKKTCLAPSAKQMGLQVHAHHA